PHAAAPLEFGGRGPRGSADRPASALDVGLDVSDRLLDGGDLLGFFVRDLALELFFQGHHQLDGVERVGAQVVDERCAVGHFLFLDAELFDDDFLDALFDGAHGFAAPGGVVVGRTGAGSAARVSLIHKADSVVKSRGRWHPHENAGHSETWTTFGVWNGRYWPGSGHVHAT